MPVPRSVLAIPSIGPGIQSPLPYFAALRGWNLPHIQLPHQRVPLVYSALSFFIIAKDSLPLVRAALYEIHYGCPSVYPAGRYASQSTWALYTSCFSHQASLRDVACVCSADWAKPSRLSYIAVPAFFACWSGFHISPVSLPWIASHVQTLHLALWGLRRLSVLGSSLVLSLGARPVFSTARTHTRVRGRRDWYLLLKRLWCCRRAALGGIERPNCLAHNYRRRGDKTRYPHSFSLCCRLFLDAMRWIVGA